MFETLYFTKFPNNGLILLPRSCAVEAQRRLIARDPAHARPEGRGLRFFSPVYRLRAYA